MAKKRAARSSATRSSSSSGGGGSAGGTVLAFVLGAGVAAGAGYLYLHSTPAPPAITPSAEHAPAPVAASKPAPPSPPLLRTAPFGTSEDGFEAAARQYSARCAGCHGTPAKDAAGAPATHQFWRADRHNIASQAPGAIYAGISTGAPGQGMPSYARILTDTQIWQLALLLKNAGGDLPDPVVKLLNTPSPSAASK